MKFINKNPKIYLIAGKARSGKDLVVDIIKNIATEKGLKHINLKFASYIRMYVKEISDWDGNEENKPRELLQQIGTELVKHKIDENMFVNRIIEDIKVYSHFFDIITVSDVRYPEEIEIPKEKFNNVVSIYVKRDNFDNMLRESEKNHLSETSLDNYNNFDYILENNASIHALENDVRNKLEKDLI